jgi:hypothetical protein
MLWSVAVLLILAAVSAKAERPCVVNYSESGQWSTGKSYKSWVEFSGADVDAVLVTLGRLVASEGWLGITANKDLGLVTAYQEDNGKKSPVNGTVSQPQPDRIRVDVTFQLARGLRAPSAGIRDGLCKLLEGTVPADQQASETETGSGIFLRSESGDVALETTVGEFRKAGFGPVLLLYFDFEPARAAVRTSDRRPALVLRTEDDPTAGYMLIRFETDERRRSIKLGSAGSIIRAGFTGDGDLAPDKDWTRPFTATQEAPGVWRVQPERDLEPGEYGLWQSEGYGAASFGVD